MSQWKVTMIAKLSVVSILVFTAAQSQIVSISPPEPRVGDVITLSYRPDNLAVMLKSDPECQVLVALGDFDLILLEPSLIKDGDRWTGSFALNEPKAKYLLLKFVAGEKPDTVTEFLKKVPMPWTHWFNGPDGKIIAELNVWSYPTIYVLDAKGVIRYKDVRGKLLDQAVDALLKEIDEKSIPK